MFLKTPPMKRAENPISRQCCFSGKVELSCIRAVIEGPASVICVYIYIYVGERHDALLSGAIRASGCPATAEYNDFETRLCDSSAGFSWRGFWAFRMNLL